MSLTPQSAGDWWQAIGVVLGIAASFMALREFFLLPRRARQDVLDHLPNPEREGWPSGVTNKTMEEQIDFVFRNSVDLAGLNASLASSKRHIHRALRQLVSEGTVEIFMLKGITDNEHPQVPAGTHIVLPLVFKGGLPPSLRSPESEVSEVLRNL